jgi:hypothetical protein
MRIRSGFETKAIKIPTVYINMSADDARSLYFVLNIAGLEDAGIIRRFLKNLKPFAYKQIGEDG